MPTPPSATLKPNLDDAPPAAQAMIRRAPEAPMSSTLGMTNANPLSPAATTEDLIARAMDIEVRARELVQNMPELAQVAAQFIDALRSAAASRIQGPQQSPMTASPMSPMGAGAPQPAGPGAAPPPPAM